MADTPIACELRHPASRLVAIEHHTVLDAALEAYRSPLQRVVDRRVTYRLVARGLAAADAVVVHSEYARRSLAACYGFEKAVVIRPGIDTEYFRPDATRERDGAAGPFVLLWVGNLIRRKGWDLVPRILERLGAGFELRYTSGLRTSRGGWGSATATPLGRLTQAELLAEYRRADLLLLPTRFEGFGYVVAEALACGLPVVTTRCSSLPEIVDDGLTGRLCATDDVESFASAISEIAESPREHLEMRRRARIAAVERFDERRMLGEYERLLRTLT